MKNKIELFRKSYKGMSSLIDNSLSLNVPNLPIRALTCLKFGAETIKTLNPTDISDVTIKPKVFLMSAGDKYLNIKLGYKERIWGTNYSKGTIKSHQNVNEGDIIIVYCSDKENNLQGFHMIGKVKFCAPPDYIDKTTWLEPYGHIVHVDWLNEPNKENFFKLSDVYEYVKYQEWGVYLRDGKYLDVSNVGWGIDSQLLKDILNKLTKIN
jgi:hypothetical protein